VANRSRRDWHDRRRVGRSAIGPTRHPHRASLRAIDRGASASPAVGGGVCVVVPSGCVRDSGIGPICRWVCLGGAEEVAISLSCLCLLLLFNVRRRAEVPTGERVSLQARGIDLAVGHAVFLRTRLRRASPGSGGAGQCLGWSEACWRRYPVAPGAAIHVTKIIAEMRARALNK
jgi:hypothetical protein